MWFLRGQTSEKICPCKKSRSSLFILDNRKWELFMLKMIMANNNGWKWSLLLNSLDAVATADVLTANNNDLNIDETRTIHFAWLFKNRRLVVTEQANSTAIYHVGKLNHLFAAWKAEIPRDIAFIQSTLKGMQRRQVSWIRSIKERKLLQRTKKRSDNGNEVSPPNSFPGFSPTRPCGSEWKTTLGTRLFARRVWLLADYFRLLGVWRDFPYRENKNCLWNI